MNKKSVILNSILTGVAFFVFLFTLLPIDGIGMTIFLQAQGLDFVVYGLPVLLALLFGIVALVAGVLGILVACNVINNEKLGKIAGALALAGSIVALVGYVWLFIVFIIEGGVSVTAILGLIFSVAAIVLSALARKELKAPVAEAPVATETTEETKSDDVA